VLTTLILTIIVKRTQAFAAVIRIAGAAFAPLVNDIIPLLAALIDEEASGSIACIEALCYAMIPRRIVQPIATSIRIATLTLPVNLAMLFNRIHAKESPVINTNNNPTTTTTPPAVAIIPCACFLLLFLLLFLFKY
jgi:hypothetical protein